MRLPAAIALSAVSMGLGAGLVACFDLFHSTSGILDACQLDAEACVEAGTNFCSWDGGTAYTNAGIACAWLEACETPIQHHDFGDCMLRALLAYDCNASSAQPTGTTKQLWDALWQAKSCADVRRLVFYPENPVPCGPGHTGYGCLQMGTDGGYATLVYCVDAGLPAAAENCALWNQTCDPNTNDCVGCLGCYADGGGCTPDSPATCTNGSASSCPSGMPETINCSELLQTPAPTGCNPGPLSNPTDPTSACYLDAGAIVNDAGLDADAGAAMSGCTESCNGTMVTGCAHGAAYTFDCQAIDAGCQAVPSPDGVMHGAACAFSDQ